MTSQITGNSAVCSTVYLSVHQRKHRMSALLAICKVNPLDTPHKGPVGRKIFLCHDVIMMRHQVISSNVIYYVGCTGPCHTGGFQPHLSSQTGKMMHLFISTPNHSSYQGLNITTYCKSTIGLLC